MKGLFKNHKEMLWFEIALSFLLVKLVIDNDLMIVSDWWFFLQIDTGTILGNRNMKYDPGMKQDW